MLTSQNIRYDFILVVSLIHLQYSCIVIILCLILVHIPFLEITGTYVEPKLELCVHVTLNKLKFIVIIGASLTPYLDQKFDLDAMLQPCSCQTKCLN